nr:MAG TPA: hypothetical protein [Caudoviricetes sp.]
MFLLNITNAKITRITKMIIVLILFIQRED